MQGSNGQYTFASPYCLSHFPTHNDTPARLLPVPDGYADWLTDFKARIHAAQQRATLAINRELVRLCWRIGRDILERQAAQGWDTKVIDRLAIDLSTAFPAMKGFSPRNLRYMRAFAEAWPDTQIVQQVVAQFPWGHKRELEAEPRRPTMYCWRWRLDLK